MLMFTLGSFFLWIFAGFVIWSSNKIFETEGKAANKGTVLVNNIACAVFGAVPVIYFLVSLYKVLK